MVFRARVLATRHREARKKSKRPVRTGPVYYATSDAIEFALGSEDFSGTPIPMLLHENGNERDGSPQRTPLYADADYLLGPEAGHLNITGMSGLSTKTSHALFTISSVLPELRRSESCGPHVQRERLRPPVPRQAGGGGPGRGPGSRRPLQKSRSARAVAGGKGDVRGAGIGDKAV